MRRHASVRSVWFLNSLRAAIALAAAVAVADATGVQHAFWVVLGTLSVLRTSASATGSTAWRGLAGTVVGFVIGAALLVGIGTNPDALWAVFPVAVLVAAYAPGTTPFLVGQAAFTVTVVVLFNLLDPVGWTVGLLRVEDVAIGCGVSFAVGLLLWPRGVVAVVSRRPGRLVPVRRGVPDRGGRLGAERGGGAAGRLGRRLERGHQARRRGARVPHRAGQQAAEQGRPVDAGERLDPAPADRAQPGHAAARGAGARRTATRRPDPETGSWSACVPLQGSAEYAGAPACTSLKLAAEGLAGFYDAVAEEVSRPGPGELTEVPAPAILAAAVPRKPVAATTAAASNGAQARGRRGCRSTRPRAPGAWVPGARAAPTATMRS